VNSFGSTSTSQLPVLSRITAATHTHLGHREVGDPQQILCPLDSSAGQIPDRGLAVRGREAAGEVVLRHACHPSQTVQVQGIAVVAVDVVTGPLQVRQQGHRNRMRTGFRHGSRLKVSEG